MIQIPSIYFQISMSHVTKNRTIVISITSKSFTMSNKIFLFLIFLIIFNSCVSSKGMNIDRSMIERNNLNQYIIKYISNKLGENGDVFRIDTELKFRDYLTMVDVRGLVSNHAGFKMKWQCVLDVHPDTSIIERLPQLPKEFQNKIILETSIDTVDTDYMPIVYFSPVFETKEKGVFAFHESISFVYKVEGFGGGIDVIVREFIRFRIVDGAVEWLDCCGRTNDPFDTITELD